MANAMYANAMDLFAQGALVWKATGGDTFRAMIVDNTTYVPNLTTDKFFSDIVLADRIGNASGHTRADMPALTLIDPAGGGVCDANDVTFTSVATGGPYERVVIFKDTGSDATSPLVCYIDTATGLPVTANGGNINIAWDNGANKIFKL